MTLEELGHKHKKQSLESLKMYDAATMKMSRPDIRKTLEKDIEKLYEDAPKKHRVSRINQFFFSANPLLGLCSTKHLLNHSLFSACV